MHWTAPGRLDGIVSLFAQNSPLAGLVDRARKRRIIAQLRSLEDHRLNDIGISRDEIEEVVWNGRVHRTCGNAVLICLKRSGAS